MSGEIRNVSTGPVRGPFIQAGDLHGGLWLAAEPVNIGTPEQPGPQLDVARYRAALQDLLDRAQAEPRPVDYSQDYGAGLRAALDLLQQHIAQARE